MPMLTFPKPFRHQHPPIRNINQVFDEQLTLGQYAADWVAKTVGNWLFIIAQSIILLVWVILNVTAMVRHWDPYPFILMNLVLSLQAAYTAPMIMMSQNRRTERDRLEAHNDYQVNKKAEEEVRVILEHLSAQDKALSLIYQKLIGQSSSSEQEMPDSSAEKV